MTLAGTVLLVHIALGTAGLVLGPVAMVARKLPGLHTQAGEAYHWVMLGVCVSASTLAVLDWGRIWWFLPIAVGSYPSRCWATSPPSAAGEAGCERTSPGKAAPTSPCRRRSWSSTGRRSPARAGSPRPGRGRCPRWWARRSLRG